MRVLDCPAGQHAFNGGVRITNPDATAPADAYPGAAREDRSEGWNVEGENGRLVGLPRPVNNDHAWRLTVFVGLAYTQNPTTFYPIDVTYFVACA